MKAVVLEKPCTAQELIVCEVPIPEVRLGWVLVKIKAFGINRSELFTRQGDSPSVKFPRIIGIECMGEIENPSDSSFQKGQRVVSLMGGLAGNLMEVMRNMPSFHPLKFTPLIMIWIG